MDKIQQRAYNKRMEKQNLIGTKAERRRKYKEIVKDIGELGLDFSKIYGDEKQNLQFLELVEKNGLTLNEAMILQQYSKAILDRDTRAAEFLRDTAGEKPSMNIEVNDNKGLSEMSLEELRELKDLLQAQKESESD